MGLCPHYSLLFLGLYEAQSYRVWRKPSLSPSLCKLAETLGAGEGCHRRLRRLSQQGEGSRYHQRPSAPSAASLPPRGSSCLQPGEEETRGALRKGGNLQYSSNVSSAGALI